MSPEIEIKCTPSLGLEAIQTSQGSAKLGGSNAPQPYISSLDDHY